MRCFALPDEIRYYQKAAETVRLYGCAKYYRQNHVRFDQKKFWWMDKLGFPRYFSALQMLAEIFRNDQL